VPELLLLLQLWRGRGDISFHLAATRYSFVIQARIGQVGGAGWVRCAYV